ncbi:uncharacterized protein FA14DRAFT_160770 [Meira miltonrushii]|uniref:FAD-binding PCMH-type domain-containing protein n=1 Tax=Meira miltonrushii TaxID=1280837 RepID=A0A316VHD0_9BASI|nr:uncharacterized protein FA14DRAFT_160770 [Meira miltonrushii]PWN35743.1 hypothetical protein FA14DRAFT_160770 [Meira miltonrushii]
MGSNQINPQPQLQVPPSVRPTSMNRSSSAYDIDLPLRLDDHSHQIKMNHYSSLADDLRKEVSGTQVHVRDARALTVEELPEQKEAKTQTEQVASTNDTFQNHNTANVNDPSKPTSFASSTTLFNSAAPLAAWLVVRPKNAEDVVKTIKFCVEKNLSPSIRSGGFSTAGWSIQGDVVLDMRSMNRIKTLPLAERENPKYRLNVASSSKTTIDGRPNIIPNQSFAKQDGRGRAADKSNSNAFNDATNYDGDGSSKRRKPETFNAEQINQTAREINAVIDADSGADADEENSNDSKGSNSGRSGSDREDGEILKDAELVSSPRQTSSSSFGRSDTPNSSSAIPGSSRSESVARSTGTPQSNDTSSGHPSSNSATTSGENGATTTATSSAGADVEMTDDGKDSNAMPDLKRTQEDNFEYDRWKRHHRPPGQTSNRKNTINTSSTSNADPRSQADRLVLPTTGGFIWTAGDSSSGGSSLGTTRPLNSGDPVYMGGATLPDLQAAQYTDPYRRGGVATDAGGYGHSGATPALHGMSLDFSDMNGGNNQNGTNSVSPQSEHVLKPGIHTDKFILVEFEPGVGVRDLDLYTDQAGRDGFSNSLFDKQSAEMSPSSSDEKGKSRMQPTNVKRGENGLSFALDGGVPYHVPLSAYPVGSTAMTIGGFGYMSRAYGLSLDNIVELDIVLADGRLKTLNASSLDSQDQEERDLWWAVRGAAPCFGIVTRIIAKAYPVPQVYAGNLIYPFNKATAPSLLRHWRDCLKGTGGSIPRELYSNLILTAGPPDASAEHVIVIQICYLGTGSTEEIGHNFVQAISSWTGERVLLKDISEKSMLTQQDGVAKVLKSGQGRRWMVRGDLLTTLTDEVISKSIDQFCSMANRAVWLFELVGGAIEDAIEKDDTCVGKEQRQAKFTAGALQQWIDRDEDEECVKGVESWVNNILAPVSVGGPFAAFLERGETRQRCEGAFGKENFEKLLRIKRAVDPNGVFCHTFGRGLVEFAKE